MLRVREFNGAALSRGSRSARRLMARFAGLVTCFCLLGLAACGDEETDARLSPLGSQALVLAFGDSLTQGAGARPEQSYPAVLEDLIGRRVLRAGVSGEVSSEGLQRLPALLDRYRPDLLILCHGGNDLLRRLDRRQLAANLEAMVAEARTRGIETVLVGVPEPGLWLDEGGALYRDLARRLALPYEGQALAHILADNKLKSSLIHPNAAGYRMLAERLATLLQTHGALPSKN